jgi:serine/threonine protein kinase
MAGVPPVLAHALEGRYALEREVGRGGMATVWLARDLRYERLVAVKVLHPELGAALGAERFLREIRVTAQLQHPHILPVFDSGDVQDERGIAPSLLWFTMPYCGRGEPSTTADSGTSAPAGAGAGDRLSSG